MRILVVEDEPKLNDGIVAGLQSRGYAADSALDGEEGERLAMWNEYDLIILDIMMPKRDGLTVCRNLRAAGKTMPIIMLTAKDAIVDKVSGLDTGADDYVVKPFSFEELVARIRSLLRRPPMTGQNTYELDGLVLDTRTQSVVIGKKELELTMREYALLEYFLRNQGVLVTRDELIEHVWDRNYDGFSNVVDVHLKNLRKKLPAKYAKRIETIWGKGYRLI